MIAENLGHLRLIVKSIANRNLDALDLLQMDHLKIRALCLQVKATKSKLRHQQLFARIKKELEIHAAIEEEIFYPACKKVEKLKDLVLEAEEEHKQMKRLLHEIDALEGNSERWEPKLRLLIDNIEHHAREVEGQLFPKVRRHFDYKELEEMGKELVTAKKKEKAAA